MDNIIENKKNTCTACEFIKNGVKTRKHIEHTCGTEKIISDKKFKQTVQNAI